ncbi:MAG: DUF983 domain-containing protein [Pseudomonadota bacterium]
MPKSDPHLLIQSAKGLCPQCGAQTLFAGPIRFAPNCPSCGLDYAQFNVGDGPAAFLTMIVGGVILALALVLEFKVHPPLWLHLVLWTPLIIALVMGSLRVAKGALLILEYRNKARDGKIVPAETKP